MKKCFFILALALTCLLAGCGTVPVLNFYEPFKVTNNPIGSKVGEAEDSEGGILQAARNGGITKIATVDIRHRSDGTVTVIVSGE
jgi:hypothetical protein